MAYQAVFKRYELKFLLTQEQKTAVLHAMEPYMTPDPYGRTTIRNIYYDTDTYRLVRHSLEKPAYKEKLRIRSYSKADPHSTVFVELKKKYGSVVYKRRLSLEEKEAEEWVSSKIPCREKSQITEEIDYFLDYYKTLHPAVFLSYEREAYYQKENDRFRVTFDEHILCRQEELSLKADIGGISLLPDNTILMEIKCSGGIPLWMAHTLSREHIYEKSFSKYGTAYRTIIYPRMKGALQHA